MHNATLRLLAALGLALTLGACGKAAAPGTLGGASARSGFSPATVTKNTTRLGDGSAAGDAAAVAQAVYPGLTTATRPAAIALVDAADWHSALAASVLSSAPLHLPLLYTHGDVVPGVTAAAVAALAPRGTRALGGAELVRVGTAGGVSGYATRTLGGTDAAQTAAAIAATVATARGAQPRQVLIVAADGDPAYAMPAAGLAAESGAPILYVAAGSVPPATRAALAAMGRPTMYVVGPTSQVPAAVTAQLRALGPLHRIGGGDPVANAIAIARYSNGGFGWGVVDPGHGLVFVRRTAPLDAGAAAPLSASGDYGPILLLDSPDTLPDALKSYLLSIQPGYTSDPRYQPVRGVYNRGWLIGGTGAVSAVVQARLDTLLEISLRQATSSPPAGP